MKTRITILRATSMLLLSVLFQITFASITGGSIMGQVTDPVTKTPVDGATVVLDCLGNQQVFVTNEHGYYYAGNIPAGVYTISASYMNNRTIIKDFKIGNDETREANVNVSGSVGITDVVVTDYIVPIVDVFNPDIETHLERAKIKQLPVTKVEDLQLMIPATVETGGEYYVRGARSGSLSYYIDGARVMGIADIPLCGLDTYRTYTGFVPPKYGDCLAGAVVMETRNFFAER